MSVELLAAKSVHWEPIDLLDTHFCCYKAPLFKLVYLVTFLSWGYLKFRFWLFFFFPLPHMIAQRLVLLPGFVALSSTLTYEGYFPCYSFFVLFLSPFILIHLFQTDGYFSSVLSLKFSRRHLYSDKAAALINLPSKLDSHSPQKV